MKDDNYYMQQALDLASKGIYDVKSNPMVGCIIVKNKQIISQGYHQKIGANHAEINALKKINFNAKNCDIYITLEPCSHYGKTPPCVDRIIKSMPQRVIISSIDYSLEISSIEKMRNAGIKVITDVFINKEQYMNRGFHKRVKKKLPFLTCKIAASLDGRTAIKNGESKWITGKEAKDDVFKLRAQNSAIITGSGTILADNPLLDVRINNWDSPLKIIMDRSNKIINKNLNIFQGNKCIVTNKSPLAIMQMLGKMQINYCMLEAGSLLNNAFLPYIDELIVYSAPIIMGNTAKPMFNTNIDVMNEKISLQVKSIKKIGTDIKITYHFIK